MKFKKNEASKLLLMMMATLAISVSAEQIEASSTRVMGTVVDPKGEVFEKLNIIQAPLTRLVIYRLPDQNSKNAAGVEINGHYHTSLQAGSYSELCLPAPTRPLISTRMAELEQVVKNDVDATKTLDLKPSQEVYLRVTERNDGSAKLDVVSADAAKVELKKTYLQLHAASRVPNAGACVTEIATQKQTGQSFKQVETQQRG
jgi:OmpA-OmpF porin, OOP family